MYSLEDDFNKFFGFDIFALRKDENVIAAFSKHLDKLAKKAFKDRQLLIGNLLAMAKDAYDCDSEYFTAICKRIEKECNNRNYELK